MYFSHLLESGFALTTGKQYTYEKGKQQRNERS